MNKALTAAGLLTPADSATVILEEPVTSGLAIPRGWILLTKTGEVVLDWGDGRVQDVLTGEFLEVTDQDYGRAAQDSDLEVLRKAGRVESFDARTVYLRPLPEPPRPTIE